MSKRSGFGGVTTRLFKVYGAIIEMAWAAARGRAATVLTLFVFLGVTGAIGAFLSKFVVDGLVDLDSQKAVTFAIAYLIVQGGSTLANDVLSFVQNDLGDRMSHEVDQRLMTIAAGAPGLDHLERSEFADRMKQVRERQWIPPQILQTMSSVFYVIFGMISAVFMLGSIDWVLALLPLVMIPSAWIQFRAFRGHWKEMTEATPEQRLADHHLKLATTPLGAKEIRLFGLRKHILAEHERLSDTWVRKIFRARMKQSAKSTVGGVLYGLSLTAAVGYLGWLALHGRATSGEIAMGIQVTRLLLANVEMAANVVANLAETAYMGEQYLWLLHYEPAIRVREQDPLPPPSIITDGIRFEDVHFSYPNMEKKVLDGVSLHIPASSTIAIVGENGAGKSSLVKLLSRFYDPTAGRITVDGIDLREMDLDAWRARMATAFQDFVRFQLIARETVGVGDLPRIEDADRVGTAVHFAGANRVVDKLPLGIETQLGRQFKDGHDLSEGEWQRFAIARGSMREEPALIVLDEPTASLDARAEHEVFERFSELAAPRNGTKPITVLVSHRFSTVRMADLIVVLHEGKIEEVGSHEQLMEAGGRYSELFRMQASRYD